VMNMVEDYFKGLADVNRLRIINLLLNGELCGCDIQYVIGASQSNVSRHLAYLKKSGLVSDRRSGYRVYYRLVENNKAEYTGLIAYLQIALKEKPFVADAKRLKQAIKDGACSVSELRLGLVSARSGLQTHMRRQRAR
jgi:ArsR family transcriptional regulator, arsenate/arsenite/antimonite-responsive transcriptional repressor